mmetsp:Transcript_91461/g.158559  ORF Transcript_91461/g.158559 Transcript_91461/m.158559 type:complete len:310 (-) Transcript_91461:398-1327(-)
MEGLHEAKPAPKKFVAPGSAGRIAKMAPTAFHAQSQQRDGESKVQGATRGQSGEDGEERGRFIPRQSQSSRFYGSSRGEGMDNQQPPSQRDHPPNQQRRTYYNPNQERRSHHHREGADVPIRRPAPENPTIYKLARSYTFSVYRRPAPSKQDTEDYAQSIKTIGSFDTVNQFWAFYSHLVRPTDLQGCNADVHLFVKGIPPLWEHEANRDGGKFSVRLKKGAASRLWEELLMAFVGEQFEASDDICGVIVSVRFKDTERKRDVLSVWIKDVNNTKAQESVGRQLRSILQLTEKDSIEFKPHSSSLQPPH